jgi:hypothetical protein
MGLKTFHTSHGLLIAAAVTRKTPIRAPHHAQKMNSKFLDRPQFCKTADIFFPPRGMQAHGRYEQIF